MYEALTMSQAELQELDANETDSIPALLQRIQGDVCYEGERTVAMRRHAYEGHIP